MIYVYHTITWYDTTNVIGIDPVQAALDEVDWTNNYESLATSVSAVNITQDNVQIDLSWSDFKTIITGVTGQTWGDVIFTEDSQKHDIYLLIDKKLL